MQVLPQALRLLQSFRSLVNADLPASGVTASTYGSTTAIPVLTVNAKGVITSATTAAITGAVVYQGAWNALTNTPALASGVGFSGYYYVVSVAGTTNLDGITDWQVGDWAIFNGSTWQKIDQTNTVSSVNGQVGVVSIAYADLAGAIPTWNQNTTGTADNVTGTVAIANGGSGQTTAQAAMDAFAGAVTSGSYLRGDGTNVVMNTIQVSDVPTLNQNTTGTADNVTGTVAIANGGSGQTTAQAAMDAFAGAVTSGSYLRGDGTNVVMNTIQVSDVPTLNQNTTGTADNVTGTVAIANGGSGQTTASAAFNALSPITTTGDLILGTGVNTASRLAIGSNGYLLTSNGTTASWSPAGVTSFDAGTTGLTPATATTGVISLAGTLAVANGGTGATNDTDARTNLVAAQSGVNNDITDLYALDGTAGGVAYQNASNQLIMGPAMTFDGTVLSVPGGISGGTF
jgi:hypothetical protein